MATDTFTRANETPLASPWVKAGGSDPASNINLTSNAVTKTTSGDVAVYYAGAASGNDQFSQAKIIAKPVENDWGPAVRIQSGVQLTFYFCQIYEGGGSDHNIDKLINDVFTRIVGNTGIGAAALNDTLRIEASGSTLTTYRNGVADQTTTDTSIPSGGQPGIFIYNTGGAIDDWAGGSLGGGGTLQSLAASIQSVSGISPSLRVTRGLKATLASQSSMTGSLAGAKLLAATLASAAAISPTLRVYKSLAAVLPSVSSLSATLRVTRSVAASIGSVSELRASLQTGVVLVSDKLRTLTGAGK